MTAVLEGAGTAGGYPERAARPGGRWSSEGLLEEILRLAAAERALAHLIAGWVPKVPDLDVKIRLAAALEETMGSALALRGHALTLFERDEQTLGFRGAWVEPLRELDRSESPESFVAGFAGATACVRGRYEDLAARLDPLYDARLLATARGALAARERGSEGAGPPDGGPLASAWSDEASPWSPLSAVAWAPMDRVPVPARPAGRPRPEPGAMGHLRQGSRHDDRNIAGELNENVTAELCAMELLCRCSYEHPDQPWPWHMALARHISDEARHAAIFRRLLAQRGYDEGGLPQHATNYELSYAFPECEPGSKRELLWRLLMLCTVLEGLAIDKIPPEIATLDWLGQHDIARALDYISTDELYHAENGLRLTRQLCEQLHLDPLIERERVHGRFFGRQLQLRESYLAADPERAAREIAVMEGPDPDGTPFTSRTEVDLRKRASFSDAEMEQVRRWGYNPRG
jgi:uncharacterized ferritin-like protein (DUF455 family)